MYSPLNVLVRGALALIFLSCSTYVCGLCLRTICKDEIHPLQAVVLQHWRNIMETAEYKCSAVPLQELNHFSLNSKVYTQFTSPIRRYVDLIVHRLVHAALDNKPCPYKTDEIRELCAYITDVTSRQKQFSHGCQALSRADKMTKTPMTFTAIVKTVSDSGADLCIPSVKHLSRQSRELPFNVLDFSKKHEESEDTNTGKTIVTGKWKKRLYDLTGCPSEFIYNRNRKKTQKPVTTIVDPHQQTVFVNTLSWAKVLKSLFGQDLKMVKKLMNSIPQEGQNPPSGPQTRDMVTSEVGDGTVKFHQCKFSLCLGPGRVIRVQMAASPEKGILTPEISLFHVCKNLSLCLSHMSDPVGILRKYATESVKKNIESIAEYQRLWLPLLEMEAAKSAVENEENLNVNNVTFEFKRKQKRNNIYYKGYVILPSKFLLDRCIEFGGKRLHNLKEDDASEEEVFYDGEFSSVDYLCIRCPISQSQDEVRSLPSGEPTTEASRPATPQKGSSSDSKKGRAKEVACPMESPAAISCTGDHAQIMKVRRMKGDNWDSDFVTVTFSINANSATVPDKLFPRAKGTVEVIFKTEVDRRTMRMVQTLKSGSSDLAECIALHRRTPKLDKDHHDLGMKIETEVPVVDLPRNNVMQQEAIRKALSSSFSLIQGPPGTGKTYTGIKLVYLFNKINKILHLEGVDADKKQVLFCGPSNKAVDLVARLLLMRLGEFCPKIIRVYGSNIVSQDYPVPKRNFMSKKNLRGLSSDPHLYGVSLHHVIRQNGKPHADEIKVFDAFFQKAIKENKTDLVTLDHIREYSKLVYSASCKELEKCDVVLCTCAVSGNRKIVGSTRIYQCIVDESAMSPEPQCMVPIIATKAKQVVLIGDHKQLHPIVKCREAKELGLDRSLFERFSESATFLNTQYRMNPRICEFPSEMFYDGKLTTGPSLAWELQGYPLSLWPVPTVPHVLCHVEGQEENLSVSTDEGNEQSKSNKAEVDKVVEVFDWLVTNEHVRSKYIKIISQYNAQCAKIREALSRYLHPSHMPDVSTVVASQGGEWDYVIFSTVRSLPYYKIEETNPTEGWCKHNLGFITDANQINVALTRSRKGLIIIGNRNLLRSDKVFRHLIEKYGKQGCLVDGSDFPRRFRRNQPM